MEHKAKQSKSVFQMTSTKDRQKSFSSTVRDNRQTKNIAKKSKNEQKQLAINIIIEFIRKHAQKQKGLFLSCFRKIEHAQNTQLSQQQYINCQIQKSFDQKQMYVLKMYTTLLQKKYQRVFVSQCFYRMKALIISASKAQKHQNSQQYQQQTSIIISKNKRNDSSSIKKSSSVVKKFGQPNIQISANLKKKLQNLHRTTIQKNQTQILTLDEITSQLKRIRQIKSIKNIRGNKYSDIQILLIALRHSQQNNKNRVIQEKKKVRITKKQENRITKNNTFSSQIQLVVSKLQIGPLLQVNEFVECSKNDILQCTNKKDCSTANLFQKELCKNCQEGNIFNHKEIGKRIQQAMEQNNILKQQLKNEKINSAQKIQQLGQIINKIKQKLTDYQQNQTHFYQKFNDVTQQNQNFKNQLLAEKRKVFQIRKKLQQQIQTSHEKTARIRHLQNRSVGSSPKQSDSLKQQVENMRSQIEAMKSENFILREKNKRMKDVNNNKQAVLSKLDDQVICFGQEITDQITKIEKCVSASDAIFNLQSQKRLVIEKLSQKKFAQAINDFRILIQKANWKNQLDSDIQIFKHIIKIIQEIELLKAKNYRLEQNSQKTISSKYLPKNIDKQSSLEQQVQQKLKQRYVQLKDKLKYLAQQKSSLQQRISDLQSQLFQSYKNSEKLQEKVKKLQLDKIQIQQKYIDEILKIQNKYGRQKTDNASENSITEKQSKISSQNSRINQQIKLIKTISREGSNESLIKSLSDSVNSIPNVIRPSGQQVQQNSDNSLLLQTEIQNHLEGQKANQKENMNQFQVLKRKIMKFLDQKQKQRQKVWNRTEKHELFYLNTCKQLNPQESDGSLGRVTIYDHSAAECQDEIFLEMMKIQICNLINNQKMYFQNFFDKVKQKFVSQSNVHHKNIQILTQQLKSFQYQKSERVLESSQQISFRCFHNFESKVKVNDNQIGSQQVKKIQSKVSLYEEQFGSQLQIKQKTVKNLQKSLEKYKFQILQLLTDKQGLQQDIQGLNQTLKKQRNDWKFEQHNLKNLHQQNLQDIQMQMDNIHKQYEIKIGDLKQQNRKTQRSYEEQLQKLLLKQNQRKIQQQHIKKIVNNYEICIKNLEKQVRQLQSKVQQNSNKFYQASQQVEFLSQKLKKTQGQAKQIQWKLEQSQKQNYFAKQKIIFAQAQTENTKKRLSQVYDQLRKMEQTLNRLEKQLSECRKQKQQFHNRQVTKQSRSVLSEKQNQYFRRNAFDLLSQKSRTYNTHRQFSNVLLQKQIESKRNQNIYLRDQVHKQDIQIAQLKNNLSAIKNKYITLQLKFNQLQRQKMICHSSNKQLKGVEKQLKQKIIKKQIQYQQHAKHLNQEIQNLRDRNNKLKLHIQHQFPLQVTIEQELKSKCNTFNRKNYSIITPEIRNLKRQTCVQKSKSSASSQRRSSQVSYIQTILSQKIQAFLNGSIQQGQVLDFLNKEITKLAHENTQLQLKISIFQNSSSISKFSKTNIDILSLFFENLGQFIQDLKLNTLLGKQNNMFIGYAEESNCYIQKGQYRKVFSGFNIFMQNIVKQLISNCQGTHELSKHLQLKNNQIYQLQIKAQNLRTTIFEVRYFLKQYLQKKDHKIIEMAIKSTQTVNE